RVRTPPDLRSFPTRRSSDLRTREQITRDGEAGFQMHGDRIREAGPAPPSRVPRSVEHYKLALILVWIGGGEGIDHRIGPLPRFEDRKSTRLNSSHVKISYAV